jgi:hypothetical protein
MSSKKFKGKTCIYCCIPESSECPDHVVARSFFLDRNRGNLPQVPACRSCNKKKSDLEQLGIFSSHRRVQNGAGVFALGKGCHGQK